MTLNGLTQLLAAITEEYGVQFSTERAAIWATALQGLTDGEGVRAYGIHILRSKFPPHPSELLNAIRGTSPDMEASLLEEGEAALRFMEARLRDDAAVDMGAALNQVVRDFGGPVEIVRQIREGEWRFRRGEAVRAYMAHRRHGSAWVSPERPDAGLRDPDHEVEQAELPVRDIPGLPSPSGPAVVRTLPELPEPIHPEVATRGLQMIREAATDALPTESGTNPTGPDGPRAG